MHAKTEWWFEIYFKTFANEFGNMLTRVEGVDIPIKTHLELSCFERFRKGGLKRRREMCF
jgi:hypothetical protein